ncbi:ArsR/SmtB family transcription factor [Aquimarina mytili]|uniref:Winged helix-turn-helix transcriptional regulator n=1 Tax=Aquimarina mytili TaxID=874423 RepID=A0A936ZUT4_9FLAO|nr:metalloregulator ArsR/SmtB family transcription factor [Aquimarina mytili]MBL0685979.1 winged helix-turn-helix transcriptional regulator [Aquimarina mytili]
MRRDVFQAIADPVRREIIELLAEETLTVNAIAEKFDISRPAISKHLKILKECEIIDFKKEGRERFCHIKPKKLIPAFMWIEQYRGLWEDKLNSFEKYLNKLQTKTNLDEYSKRNGQTNHND